MLENKYTKKHLQMFDLPDDEILSLSKEHVFYLRLRRPGINPIAVKRAKGVHFWDCGMISAIWDFNSMTMCGQYW